MDSALFSSMALRDMKVPNRIVVSPMCQYSAVDGSATPWHLVHLGQMAMSGAGRLILEAAHVEARGRITPNCLGLYSDENESALVDVIAFCREHGAAKLGIQLSHAGRKGSARPPWDQRGAPLNTADGGWPTRSCSGIPRGDGWPVPETLDTDGLRAVKDAHVDATRRADRLGLDLIEVNAAHGYLLHEFLSPHKNRRHDAYGDDLEKRMRYPLELFATMRAAWPDDKPMGVRISAGLRHSDGARTAMVTFIQRFGSKLNLNVHLHVLALDGAYSFEHGKARFHRVGGLRPEEHEALLTTIITRITRTLVRAGVLVAEDEQPYLDLQLDSPYEQLAGAAIRYVIAAGPQAGRATMRLRDPLLVVGASGATAKPFTAARDGFSLNCAVACDVHEPAKLERLCRYMARGPIAQERVSVDGDRLVVLELKRAFSDGTTHVLFEPHDFIARLAALVPRRKAHVVRYHGVFAPNAHRQADIVTRPKVVSKVTANHECASNVGAAPMSWMACLKRVLAIDLKRCPHCGGELRMIAVITGPGVISRILQHLGVDWPVQPRAPPMTLANCCH